MRLLLYKHKSVMKRILFMIILGLGGLMPVNRTLAQRAGSGRSGTDRPENGERNTDETRSGELFAAECDRNPAECERYEKQWISNALIDVRASPVCFFYALWRFAGNDKTGGGTSRSFCFKRNTRKGEGTGCSEKKK